ncbi:hypothetical protein TIFTF001_007541 [Ficus carica]|uniref:F-box domain-containing protein n=1 Tax=Ficus carica TaxID=3494 RepID=A0AA88CZR8_FICCA|nr:hypothetical protein TIFTF001_007541 [Ficus carica]
MNRFCHLPEEVVEGIVLRMSPKSLISCKRVCKSWHALINGKSFWKRQELTLDEIFTPFYSSGKRKQVMTLVTISGDRLPCVVEEISLPPAPKTEEKHFPKSISFHWRIQVSSHTRPSPQVLFFRIWIRVNPVGLNLRGCTWKDEELLMETKDGRIVSYNLATQKLRQLRIPGAVLGTTYADLCLESLVSIKREMLNH